jgi:hypothetical protein
MRVTAYCERRNQRLAARLQQGVRSTMSKFQVCVCGEKHEIRCCMPSAYARLVVTYALNG